MTTPINPPPGGDENENEEWAASGPEPNDTGTSGTPLRGVVPAGAMSEPGTDPATSSPAPSELTPFAADLEASNQRQAVHVARLTDIDRRSAALDAERALVLCDIHAEASHAASLWVPLNRAGYDQYRIADTEAAQEVAAARRISKPMASAQISEALMLTHDLPTTFDALKKGDISYRHVQRITSHATSLPVDSRGPFEDLVVPIAMVKTVNQAEPKLKDTRERMHPESITERHIKAVEDRSVWLTGRPDGMVELTALLPAQIGVSAFGRISTAADVLKTKDETRTKPQRMADVFTDLLLDSLTAATRGVVPTVLVTIPICTAAGLGDEPGNLNGYGIISPDTARDLFAKAPSFRRVLVDEDTGEVLNLGRTRYRPTAGQRLAVTLAHPTCAGIGCTKRAELCDIDHTDPYNEGAGTGLTDLPNLHPLCSKDHTDKHNTRIKVASIEGNLVWTLPSGQVVVTEPEMLVHDKPVTLKVTQVPEELKDVDLFAHTTLNMEDDDEPDAEEWDPNAPTPF